MRFPSKMKMTLQGTRLANAQSMLVPKESLEGQKITLRGHIIFQAKHHHLKSFRGERTWTIAKRRFLANLRKPQMNGFFRMNFPSFPIGTENDLNSENERFTSPLLNATLPVLPSLILRDREVERFLGKAVLRSVAQTGDTLQQCVGSDVYLVVRMSSKQACSKDRQANPTVGIDPDILFSDSPSSSSCRIEPAADTM